MYTYETIFNVYIHISIDYSDFKLSGASSTTVFVQSLYDDYTSHSLNILWTRLVQLSTYIYQGSFKFAIYLTDFRH